VDLFAIFREFQDSPETALGTPGVLESLPKYMRFKVEGFSEIGILIEYIIHQGKSFIEITFRLKRSDFHQYRSHECLRFIALDIM
jgi:hypothetical protein